MSVENAIQIYARIRPSKNPLSNIEINDNEIQVKITKSEQGLINHQKELHTFHFDAIFGDESSQVQVFDTFALPTIKHVLMGYHGTLFVYGQTGTGKTFSMTGGNDNFQERGVMPRTLEYIFNEINSSGAYKYAVAASYMEIYNETGYDLLDQNRESTKLDELPRVTIMEDELGNFNLKNLRILPCHSVEDAMDALFLGDTNKMMAETPSNPQSSRSHCVFTIYITRSETGSSKVCKSVLHLVDLAGSERVSRSGIDGKLLKEAKHINLSLHYLEQVIISLQTSKKKHIPYRNSMLTCILREALGGNCKTSMVATFANEIGCLEEGVSTFRFAQRVALVSNSAHINEELDPVTTIKLLKEEIKLLKYQISVLSGQDMQEELKSHDFEKLDILVESFLNNSTNGKELIMADSQKMLFILNQLKMKYEKPKICTREDSGKLINEEVQILEKTISQRNEEIKVLLQLKKQDMEIVSAPQTPVPTKEMATFASLDQSSKEDLFNKFKNSYQRLNWIEDSKKRYNEMVLSAQALSQTSLKLKNEIQNHPNHTSNDCLNKIQTYKDIHDILKERKVALDHHKRLLEKSKIQLKTDFNAWLLVRKRESTSQEQSSSYSEFRRLKDSFVNKFN